MNTKERIQKFKSEGKGLMTKYQYEAIGNLLEELSPCKFLVFGLGEDSFLWSEINAGGRTVFLEDDIEWSEKFQSSNLEIHNVKYTTEISKFNEIKFDKERLRISFPETIDDIKWDLILVDAPLGHGPPNPDSPWKNTPGRPFKGPGRMSSIFEASTRVKKDGFVIVDDLSRKVEAMYSDHFLGKENLKQLIENKVGIYQL